MHLFHTITRYVPTSNCLKFNNCDLWHVIVKRKILHRRSISLAARLILHQVDAAHLISHIDFYIDNSIKFVIKCQKLNNCIFELFV